MSKCPLCKKTLSRISLAVQEHFFYIHQQELSEAEAYRIASNSNKKKRAPYTEGIARNHMEVSGGLPSLGKISKQTQQKNTVKEQPAIKKRFDRNDKENKPFTGSLHRKASPWINGVVGPAMPIAMLSKVLVYDGWLNPYNANLAKQIISKNNDITFNELCLEMFKISGHYDSNIWWVWPSSSKIRVLYKDANGLTFVKLDNKWHLIYSMQLVGVLAKLHQNYGEEDSAFPKNLYFISFDNEKIAKNHS